MLQEKYFILGNVKNLLMCKGSEMYMYMMANSGVITGLSFVHATVIFLTFLDSLA